MTKIAVDKDLLKQALDFIARHSNKWNGTGEHPQTISEEIRAALVEPAGKLFHAKFNVGEHVWYMKNNKPTEVVISAVEVFFVNTNQDRITYNAKNVTNAISWLDHTNLQEGWLFKTKVELLESL